MLGITFKKVFGILFQLLLLGGVFFVPMFKLSFDVATILTVLSLFFTILLGFFIAATTSNYLRMQTIIATEDAQLISIYNLVKMLQPAKAKKLANLIDLYLIRAFDFDMLEYVPYTQKYWDGIVDVINSVRPKNNYFSSLLQNLHSLKDANTALRQETGLTAQKIVSKRHWFILILLSVLISVLLLSLRVDDYFSVLIIGFVLLTIYQVLRLLYNIDSNVFLAEKLGFESSQRVFLAVGKEKYYPEYVVSSKLKKILSGENYRVGIDKNLGSSEKKIKLIKKNSS